MVLSALANAHAKLGGATISLIPHSVSKRAAWPLHHFTGQIDFGMGARYIGNSEYVIYDADGLSDEDLGQMKAYLSFIPVVLSLIPFFYADLVFGGTGIAASAATVVAGLYAVVCACELKHVNVERIGGGPE